jgi:hypothetical protein
MPKTMTRPTRPRLRHEVTLDALGVRLAVRAHGSLAYVVADAVERTWSRCVAGAPADGREALSVDVLVDSDELIARWAAGRGWVAATSLDVLMHDLSPSITGRAVEHLAGRALMLRAAVLADPLSGAAAVLVGPPGVGRSTAAARLGTALGYVTDEVVAVAEDGALVPFPKPLSLPGAHGHVTAQLSPDDLGLLEAPPSLWVAAVAVLDRRPEAPAVPALEPVELPGAVATLAGHTRFLDILDRPEARLRALLAGVGGATRLSYRDDADLLPAVRSLLAGR